MGPVATRDPIRQSPITRPDAAIEVPADGALQPGRFGRLLIVARGTSGKNTCSRLNALTSAAISSPFSRGISSFFSPP